MKKNLKIVIFFSITVTTKQFNCFVFKTTSKFRLYFEEVRNLSKIIKAEKNNIFWQIQYQITILSK